MTALSALEQRIREHIPLCRHLTFELLHHQPGALRLSAPLQDHINDKSTFFAGSQAALFTLGGWALTTLEAEQVAGQPVDVVAVENQLKYTAPLAGDMVINVTAEAEGLALFSQRLARRGKARLSLTAVGLSPSEETVSLWRGEYLARFDKEGLA